MRVTRFAPGAVGAALILAVVFATVPAAGTSAATGAVASSVCSSKRLDGFGPQPVTFRLALRGDVSCAEARRTRLSYEHAILDGRCRTRICDVTFRGGWRCSSTNSVESQENGGLEGGCERKGASFRVYILSEG